MGGDQQCLRTLHFIEARTACSSTGASSSDPQHRRALHFIHAIGREGDRSVSSSAATRDAQRADRRALLRTRQ